MISGKLIALASFLFLFLISLGTLTCGAQHLHTSIEVEPISNQELREQRKETEWISKQMLRLHSATESNTLETLQAECGISSDRTLKSASLLFRKFMGRRERTEWKKHSLWLSRTLSRMQSIIPGKTQATLWQVLTTEGGIFTQSQQTFVSKACPYLKVRVEFRPSSKSGDAEGENDRIVKVSKPFLQYSIMD